MPARLPDKIYQGLINKISAIYTQANQSARSAFDRILNQAYWLIGKEIFEVEQNHQMRAPYGEHLLEGLSLKLTTDLGKGFSVTNLRNMRQFYVLHPIHQPADELGWTLHCQLLTIKDDRKREYYEKKAVAGKWTKEKLIEVLHRDNIPREPLNPSGKGPASGTGTVKKLSLKRGIPGIYRLKEVAQPGPAAADETFALMIDCGFYVYRELALKGAGIFKEGDIVRPVETKSGLRIERVQAEKKEIYTYQARVSKVVDGDTLVCVIPFGFGYCICQRLRLRGIDALELKTPKGENARDFVENALAGAPFIVVKTYQEEKYGRYLSDVFWLPGASDVNVVAQTGRFLNQVLLDEGLAGNWGQTSAIN